MFVNIHVNLPGEKLFSVGVIVLNVFNVAGIKVWKHMR